MSGDRLHAHRLTADMADFRWNRRMAYLHESEVVVVTQEPDETETSSLDTHDEDETATPKEPSPELEEIVTRRKTLPKPSHTTKPVKPVQTSKGPHPLSREVQDEPAVSSERLPSSSLSPPPPATYVCGHSDTRTGIICETRLGSREERETHQRFVHGVKASSSQHARFLAEAQAKVKKQMEQERVNKKISGQTRKQQLPSSTSRSVSTKTGNKLSSGGSSLERNARKNAAYMASAARKAIKAGSRA